MADDPSELPAKVWRVPKHGDHRDWGPVREELPDEGLSREVRAVAARRRRREDREWAQRSGPVVTRKATPEELAGLRRREDDG